MITARTFVEAVIPRKAAKLRAEIIVMDAIAAAGDSSVLKLPIGIPFHAAIDKAGADHLMFVVHPLDANWTITGIRRGSKASCCAPTCLRLGRA